MAVKMGPVTEDQTVRLIVTATAIPLWSLIIHKAQLSLRRRRDKIGRDLLERVGYRLGHLWARTYRATQKSLHRR